MNTDDIEFHKRKRQERINSANESSEAWKSYTKQETYGSLCQELEKLFETVNDNEIEKWTNDLKGFKTVFKKFLKAKSTVKWNDIKPISDTLLKKYDDLEKPTDDEVKCMLNKLIVVKLNGGLGTSMGCKGPKSAITVRDDLTFLDLLLQQIRHLNKTYDVNVPLVLMNSFNTDEDTMKLLKKYGNVRCEIFSFCQSKYLRINKESLMPIAKELNDDNDIYYPPGHGNFYESFYNSGLLDKFCKEGKDYVFLSNIDNLGATVDLNILNFIIKNKGTEFIMEVTDKTKADVKGGTLINDDNKLKLLEIAQVAPEHVDEFKSISKFRIFNTNNLWIQMNAIKKLIENDSLDMDIIVNHKHLSNGLDVIQLETAAGAAIKNFSSAYGINVPRSRFLPVKKTSDLLLLMSNLYDIEDGILTISNLRSFKTTPFIKLGSSFDKVNDFMKRFNGIPDILELDHLTVSGDVWFGRDVILKGTVIIIANHGDRIDIPPGTILENKIVSGNLRILDH
uniref:UTP--glucose-1-phosphate uridylyltransferase n=1 Tax=Parastrongyloides trichosuri TaxID=131310 RepID=A0A0N4Z9C4_PARTI